MGEQVVTLKDTVELRDAMVRLARELRLDERIRLVAAACDVVEKETVYHTLPSLRGELVTELSRVDIVSEWGKPNIVCKVGYHLLVEVGGQVVYAAYDHGKVITVFRYGAWVDQVLGLAKQIEAERDAAEDPAVMREIEALVADFGPLEEE